MDCTIVARLLIVFLCVNVGSTCVDEACFNTYYGKILSLNDTTDFCRISSEFMDCVKASCNVSELPQELYERLNTIFAHNGIHCGFTGHVSSTHSPTFDFSTRMAENNCWTTGECQATFERALHNITGIEQLCRSVDMLFSCIRNKCGIDKLPYSSLQEFKEKLNSLHTSCDLTKHFDDPSNQSPVTQLITEMTDFVNPLTSTLSTVARRSTQMTDMLDSLKSSTTAKTATFSYAGIHDNIKHNGAGTQQLSVLTFIVSFFVVVLLRNKRFLWCL